MTDRIRDFLRDRRPEGPCLVVDLDVVRDNYLAFAKALPDSRVFYAVKANPEPEVLKLLAEPRLVLRLRQRSRDRHGARRRRHAPSASPTATPSRRSATSPPPTSAASASSPSTAARRSRRSRAPRPGSKVFCRILCANDGAEWPLSRKFGCAPELAIEVLEHAHRLGLDAFGVSFHVGSQQPNPEAWDIALKASAEIFRTLSERGIQLRMVNLGGGFPAKYLKKMPAVKTYGRAISSALRKHFGNRIPETIIEPGRGMVGDAGLIKAEVVLISKKADDEALRWVYLDIGKFGGLAETMDEAIRYPIRTAHDGDRTAPCVIAGPTCDSADVLYEKKPYELPISLSIGDEVLIEGTGAYTQTYSAVAFNGFAPLKAYVI